MMQELSSKHSIQEKLAISLKYRDLAPKYEKSPVKEPFEEEEADVVVPVTVSETYTESFNVNTIVDTARITTPQL